MVVCPPVRGATTAVLVAVALISGAILLLGDRFEAASDHHTLTRRNPIDAGIAACVAEESMRLIDADREHCLPGELVLTPDDHR
ncbi:MAG TPA: hypothetical protein VG795_14390 [Acidimicrobiia bacterium]|nr:hypothetical protein [Acidimicrobiia bacterium]